MSLSMLYGESSLPITINTSSYETSTGFDISSNTGLIFVLKSNPTMPDDDAEYLINEGSDLSYSSNIITAKINDWSQIAVGTSYYIGVGFKLSGDTVFREIPLDSNGQTISFSQDVIRQ